MSRHSDRITAAIAAIPQSRFPKLCGDGLRPDRHRNSPFPPYRIVAAEVATAVDFLELLRPTHVATMSVFHLKPWIETWGQTRGGTSYVPNGAIILAADILGLVIRPDKHPLSNGARIGVSKIALVELLAGSWRTARDDVGE